MGKRYRKAGGQATKKDLEQKKAFFEMSRLFHKLDSAEFLAKLQTAKLTPEDRDFWLGLTHLCQGLWWQALKVLFPLHSRGSGERKKLTREALAVILTREPLTFEVEPDDKELLLQALHVTLPSDHPNLVMKQQLASLAMMERDLNAIELCMKLEPKSSPTRHSNRGKVAVYRLMEVDKPKDFFKEALWYLSSAATYVQKHSSSDQYEETLRSLMEPVYNLLFNLEPKDSNWAQVVIFLVYNEICLTHMLQDGLIADFYPAPQLLTADELKGALYEKWLKLGTPASKAYDYLADKEGRERVMKAEALVGKGTPKKFREVARDLCEGYASMDEMGGISFLCLRGLDPALMHRHLAFQRLVALVLRDLPVSDLLRSCWDSDQASPFFRTFHSLWCQRISRIAFGGEAVPARDLGRVWAFLVEDANLSQKAWGDFGAILKDFKRSYKEFKKHTRTLFGAAMVRWAKASPHEFLIGFYIYCLVNQRDLVLEVGASWSSSLEDFKVFRYVLKVMNQVPVIERALVRLSVFLFDDPHLFEDSVNSEIPHHLKEAFPEPHLLDQDASLSVTKPISFDFKHILAQESPFKVLALPRDASKKEIVQATIKNLGKGKDMVKLQEAQRQLFQEGRKFVEEYFGFWEGPAPSQGFLQFVIGTEQGVKMTVPKRGELTH